MEQHFRFELLRTRGTLRASYALRYQVYCEERRFLPASAYPQGLESDEHDARSLHVGAFHPSGALAGTVRLVHGPLECLPLARKCRIHPDMLPEAARSSAVAEISRLAVNRHFRRRVTDSVLPELLLSETALLPNTQRRSRSEIVLGLYRSMYQESKHRDIRYWFAAMETSLARLLQRLNFVFRPIGPEVDYYGPVTPHFVAISELEARLYACDPELLRAMAQGLPPRLQPPQLRPASPAAGSSPREPQRSAARIPSPALAE